MDWSDETWVKLYRRDTTDWLALSIGARGLFCLLLRAVSRSGVLDLGKTGPRAVAVHLRGSWKDIEPWLDELVADGCVQINGHVLVIPNFIVAQEAVASDRARAKAHRERVRLESLAVGSVTKRDEGITNRDDTVTPGHAPSRAVTRRHEEKRRDETTREETSSPAAVAPLALSAQATIDPSPTKPAKTPRAKKHTDPPPFSVTDALDAIASTAGRRFVVGDRATWAGGWVIALAKLVRQFPDLDAWRLVGAWLAAGFGGGLPTAAFGVRWAASGALPDAVAKARAWDADGRPAAFDERGFPVRAVVEAPDPWATAMRKGVVQ